MATTATAEVLPGVPVAEPIERLAAPSFPSVGDLFKPVVGLIEPPDMPFHRLAETLLSALDGAFPILPDARPLRQWTCDLQPAQLFIDPAFSGNPALEMPSLHLARVPVSNPMQMYFIIPPTQMPARSSEPPVAFSCRIRFRLAVLKPLTRVDGKVHLQFVFLDHTAIFHNLSQLQDPRLAPAQIIRLLYDAVMSATVSTEVGAMQDVTTVLLSFGREIKEIFQHHRLPW